LLATDLFWKEGMPSWKPLKELMAAVVPPPIPMVPTPPQPETISRNAAVASRRAGLDRIWFGVGLVVAFAAALLLGTLYASFGATSQELGDSVIYPLFGAIATLVFFRLSNAGCSRWLTMMLFIPLLNVGLIVYCCIKPPAKHM